MVHHLSQIQHLSPTRVAEQSAVPMVRSVDTRDDDVSALCRQLGCSTGGQKHVVVVYVTREQQDG